MGNPGEGWRERYNAYGTEEPPEGFEPSPDDYSRPDAEAGHQGAGLEAPRR
jgi:hypothetical protein